jgi:hypothetical protein
MKTFRVGLLVVLTALTACGGGGDSDVAADSGNKAGATTTTAAEPEVDVPAFPGDFDRLCTTQVGFKGVAAYEGGPGPHPLMFFDDHRGEGFVESAQQLPAGWKVEQDMNYEDNSDLQKTQLVACNDRVKEIPTGIVCDFEDDGEAIKLELVDSDYDLKVYAASTGELVHEAHLEARSKECPYVAAFQKGDKTFVNEPTEDQLINALKPVVTPA